MRSCEFHQDRASNRWKSGFDQVIGMVALSGHTLIRELLKTFYLPGGLVPYDLRSCCQCSNRVEATGISMHPLTGEIGQKLMQGAKGKVIIKNQGFDPLPAAAVD